MEKVKEMVEKEIETITKEGLDKDNLEALYKLVDIHKDIIKEEKIMKEMGEEDMRYNDGYSRGRYNDGNYGRRYMAGGNYGTHPALNRMSESYSAYRDANEEYGRGNYGAKNEKMEKLEIMLDSCLEFWESIVRENTDPESVEMIRHYMSKMQEM